MNLPTPGKKSCGRPCVETLSVHAGVCVAVVSGLAGKKSHVSASNTAPPTYVEPSAPPLTSSCDYDVTRHVTCGPETAAAPLCRRCGAAVGPCDDLPPGLPPPSYELSQQLQAVNSQQLT